MWTCVIFSTVVAVVYSQLPWDGTSFENSGVMFNSAANMATPMMTSYASNGEMQTPAQMMMYVPNGQMSPSFNEQAKMMSYASNGQMTGSFDNQNAMMAYTPNNQMVSPFNTPMMNTMMTNNIPNTVQMMVPKNAQYQLAVRPGGQPPMMSNGYNTQFAPSMNGPDVLQASMNGFKSEQNFPMANPVSNQMGRSMNTPYMASERPDVNYTPDISEDMMTPLLDEGMPVGRRYNRCNQDGPCSGMRRRAFMRPAPVSRLAPGTRMVRHRVMSRNRRLNSGRRRRGRRGRGKKYRNRNYGADSGGDINGYGYEEDVMYDTDIGSPYAQDAW